MRRFDISLSTVQRLAHQYRVEGHLRSKVSPGRSPIITPAQEDELLRLVTQPDATLASIAQAWREKTGGYIAASTVHYALQRLGYTYKKNTDRSRA